MTPNNQNIQKSLADVLQSTTHTPPAQSWAAMGVLLDNHYTPEPGFFDGVMQQKIAAHQHPAPTTAQWQTLHAQLPTEIVAKLSAVQHTPTATAWQRMNALLDAAYIPNAYVKNQYIFKKMVLTIIGVLLCLPITELFLYKNNHKNNPATAANRTQKIDAKTIDKAINTPKAIAYTLPNNPRNSIDENTINQNIIDRNDGFESTINQNIIDENASNQLLNAAKKLQQYISEPADNMPVIPAYLPAMQSSINLKNTKITEELEQKINKITAQQDKENNPTKPTKKPQNISDIQFGIKAAAVYYAAYNPAVAHYEASVSPAFGAFIGKSINEKWGIQSGAEYKQLMPKKLYSAEVMVPNNQPSTGYRAVRYTNNATKLHFIEIPLQINRQISPKSIVSGGMKAAYLLGNNATKTVDTLEVGSTPLLTVPTPEILTNDYQRQNENLQKISFQLITSYEYVQSKYLLSGVRFAYSFGQMKKGDYYNDGINHRNSDLQVYLKYRLH